MLDVGWLLAPCGWDLGLGTTKRVKNQSGGGPTPSRQLVCQKPAGPGAERGRGETWVIGASWGLMQWLGKTNEAPPLKKQPTATSSKGVSFGEGEKTPTRDSHSGEGEDRASKPTRVSHRFSGFGRPSGRESFDGESSIFRPKSRRASVNNIFKLYSREAVQGAVDGDSFQKKAGLQAAMSQLQERMFGARHGTYAHSDQAALLFARLIRKENLSLRERMFLFLNEPGSSRFAFGFGFLMYVALICSAIAKTLETLEQFRQPSTTSEILFLVIYFLINLVFTIEALMRVVSHMPFLRAYRSPILWLDVLTVVPFWVRLIWLPNTLKLGEYFDRSHDDVIRVLDAFTALRLLKLARYYEGAQLLARGLYKSASQLLVPMFMLLIMVVFCSAVLVELEWDVDIYRCVEEWKKLHVTQDFIDEHKRGVTWECADVCVGGHSSLTLTADPVPSYKEQLCFTCQGYPASMPKCLGVRWAQRFTSMPTAMWFILVTVTPAVSLDPDVYPTTALGQLFVTSTLLCGVFFLAMPLSTVGTNFNAVWFERHLVRVQGLIRQLLMENKMSLSDCRAAFRQMDVNRDGYISYFEFNKFLREVLGLKVPKREMRQLWRMMDEDNSGLIDQREFEYAMFPKATDTEEILAAESAEAEQATKMVTEPEPEPAPTPTTGTPAASPSASPAPANSSESTQVLRRASVTKGRRTSLDGGNAVQRFDRLERGHSDTLRRLDVMDKKVAEMSSQLQLLVDTLCHNERNPMSA